MSVIINGTTGITTPDVTTNDGGVYAPGNILGAVSESSGVPTGAIIERGSNANGEFVKYADGTLLGFCNGFTGYTANVLVTRTLPAASFSVPYGGFQIVPATLFDYQTAPIYLTSSSALFQSGNTRAQNTVFIFYVGRWY